MVHSKTLLSQKQLSLTLPEKESATLMTDETSKFGKKYCAFITSDEEQNSYLLGLREMSDKSARSTLNTFKEILGDISDACSAYERDDRMKSVGYKVLSTIRDTMSDRASTEKAFNDLLQDYRIRTLPLVYENWHEMSPEEQSSVSRINNFFCALHLLVGMADTSSSCIFKFEQLCEKSPENVRHESGTVELIRMCAKALSRGGDEKSGCYQQWKTYIEGKNDKVLFINFRGTRFNVLFYIAQVTFYHWDAVKDFLVSAHGTSNRLLQSIVQSLDCDIYRSCCRVLGLLAKLVTSPFWRIVEGAKHVLDLNDQYGRLHEFLKENAEDSIPSLLAGVSPFEDKYIEKDEMLTRLLKDAQEDEYAAQCIQALSLSLKSMLERMVPDQLPGGKYFACTEELRKETVSVPTHNKMPEFVFGVLDRLVRVRPNATILTNEAFLMFSYNKTGKWLESLNPEEREKVIAEARRETPAFRNQFKERQREIENRRKEALEEKKKAIEKKRTKGIKEKENYTNEILYYGLWQNSESVQNRLAELPDKEKVKALQAQLRFRNKVLNQSHEDKKVFTFSEKDTSGKYKKHSIEKLTGNLLKLVRAALDGTSKSSEHGNATCPLLVGKRVSHLFQDNGGLFTGRVISVVPGFPEWYNIKYDGDDAIYSYRLQDEYRAEDLKILPEEWVV